VSTEQEKGAETTTDENAANVAARAAEGDDEDDGPLDPQTERALNFVDMLLEKMDMDAEVTLAPDDGEGSADEIRLEIEGPDAGRVIGKRGSVLEAIQYLTTRIAHKPGEPRKHIAVDAEGYRARHEDQLAEMAQKLARRVAKEGKVITFDPMSARDRRVVHMALKEITEVRTESHGEGPDRRVQIIPVKVAGAAAGGPPSDPRPQSRED
jgi:spoIIIJ-associated protein